MPLATDICKSSCELLKHVNHTVDVSSSLLPLVAKICYQFKETQQDNVWFGLCEAPKNKRNRLPEIGAIFF